ncbi:Amino-acid carrier protein AlsT [Blautia glucerasea]|uniref:Amino-acid carrier protein AlsT n=2 Tax=Lachnospiraceae TaxID=186803 RepID=A0A6N2SXG1_9FIRM
MFSWIMELYGSAVKILSNWMYSYILIILLVGAGIYFTVRTKGIQFRALREAIRVVMEPKEDEKSISSFQALMISTASRVGTGNIAGISTALCIGGPGAMFWMWLTALLGSASAFIESALAQIYKRKAADGSSYGGPAYYIQAVLKKRWLGIVFASVLILTYMGGFNMVASFNISDSFRRFSFYQPGTTPLIVGVALALIFGICIFGGSRRISRITEVIVPLMGIFYIGVSLFIVITHLELLPGVIASIFKGAFDVKAIFGGFAGSAVMQGIKRGLFSNEAGVGSAPNASASAGVSHPAKQGLVQMLSVYIDTIVICSATGFMLLCSGVAPEGGLAGMPYVQEAVAGSLGAFGSVFITVALFMFAFTTLIGNFYYAEMGLSYICDKAPGKALLNVFRVAAALIVCLGATMDFSVVWDTADVLMGLMALINLPVIVILSKPAIHCMQDYFRQKKQGKNPVFRAKDIGLKTKTDFWNE